MKTKFVLVPENFDGEIFIKKYGVDKHSFFIKGTLLYYGIDEVGIILEENDLLDCIVDVERKNRIDKRRNDAFYNAKNIPNWAKWDKEEALSWFDERLSDGNIDSVQNLVDAKNILKDMATVLRGLGRMEIAIRDKIWAEMPEVEDYDG